MIRFIIKEFIGSKLKMLLTNDSTSVLWGLFMSKRAKIKNRLGANYYSLQNVNTNAYFKNFSSNLVFEKRALVAVSEIEGIDYFEGFKIKNQNYAVFLT